MPLRGKGYGVKMPAHGIYTISSTQKHRLGDRLAVDERVFKYSLAGGVALAPGKIMQSPVPAADHTGLAVATTAAAGTSSISLTNGATTAATKNMYRDGYLWTDTGTNCGHMWKIKSNTASAINVAFTVTLFDEFPEVLTAGAVTCSLVLNPYRNLIIQPGVPTAAVMGVAPVDVTAEYYFWLQTWGPASILTTDTVVIGEQVGVADDDDGAMQAADTYIEQLIGTVMRIEADTQYSAVYLRLSP